MEYENKTRTDYEITVIEGQKISDVFHEVGLPTHIRGKRKVIIEIHSDEETTTEEERTIYRLVVGELEEWGFLDKDIFHILVTECVKSDDYKLKIYTE